MKKLAVIGPNADSRWPLIANYHGTAPRYVTVLEGIESPLGEETRIYYSEGCHTMKEKVERLAALPGDRISEAVTAARKPVLPLFVSDWMNAMRENSRIWATALTRR